MLCVLLTHGWLLIHGLHMVDDYNFDDSEDSS